MARQMPALEHVEILYLQSAVPQELLLYTQLHTLDLSWLRLSHMPEWFSGMTQLKTLLLDGASLQSFPLCLLPLCQLKDLRMMDLDTALAIPAEIAQTADWHCLESRCLDVDAEYDFDSRLHLLALCHELRSRDVFVTISCCWCSSP